MKNKLKFKTENIFNKVVACSILFFILFFSIKDCAQFLNIGQKVETTTLKEKEGKYLAQASAPENMCKYLSDMEYEGESKVGWGSITLDSNLETQYNNGLITLLVNGKKTYFLKGISAHATSTLIYNISSYDYDHFSTYIGVDESRGENGNGVKFEISTSTDGENWVIKEKSDVLRANGDAKKVVIDLDDDVKYLKLYCDQYGNNASDHSVYADAKLYKDGYEEKTPEDINYIKTVEQYDNELKNLVLDKQIEGENEFTLLKREFVKNVGYDLLIAIVNLSPAYEEAVKWLVSDVNNLRLYVLGGAPDGGSYYNSIKELSRLLEKYKNDFNDTTKTNNPWDKNLTKGDVYKKMAISLSLTHATKVGYWAQIDHPANRSDSVERYRIYKKLYDEGKFKVNETQDQGQWYEALKVEEMRYVMNNITDDEELEWFNAYTQKRIDEHKDENPEKYLQPHTYIAYVWPNFDNPIFHDPDKKMKEWDVLFEGIFSKYGVSYTGDVREDGTVVDKVYKAWMSMRNSYGTGAVCGGISKLGCHIRAAHGTPASVISQPGHAAIIYYRKDASGKGYWSMDNDVSGWAQSGASEKMQTRMPLGWGNDSYVSGWAATYMMLSQEAINDYTNYEKSEKIIMTADIYKGDVKKQEQIYREALKVQKINIDAWWGLINAYKEDTSKTEKDFFELATELGNALMPFPLPMKNLLDQIEENIKTVDYSFRFTLLETDLLTQGKNLSDDTAKNPETYKVYQPSITRTVANFLLGQTDTSLATFSFDGADAGKIVLSSRFDGIGVRWDYNLSGKDTISDKNKWTEVSFDADAEHKLTLSRDQIASITADNDIYVHIVGTDYSESNVYKIDIEEQTLPTNLYANDLENRVIGIDIEKTQWRYKEGDNWNSYKTSSPDLTGNKTIQVRQTPTGNKLASEPSEIFKFTEDNQPENRKYISVSNLSIKDYPDNKTETEERSGYSTQSRDSGRPYYAPNAIDGNINTLWHTDFADHIVNNGTDTYITVELNYPKYISAVEFIQTKYKENDPDYIKNATILVSEDGKKWTEVKKSEDFPKDIALRVIDFDESVKAKYVRLKLETYDMFASISMINLYEDTTKIDKTKPTAEIEYSTKELTKDYVIVKLVNPSTEITVTNNNGSDTYIFKENGDFTFEFEDKNGNKGTAYAKVDWIDTEGPTADVDYVLDGNKKLRILLDSISEDVYLLDDEDRKINYVEVADGKVNKISYLDTSGNVYKVEELDENGNITKITYTNTTGKAEDVKYYVTVLKDGVEYSEDFLDENGVSISAQDIPDDAEEMLRGLKQIKANPLEYTFEESGDYQFKLLDKASNIAYKSIKADYLEDDNIIASDISYNITKTTNKNVIATINPYMINNEGKKIEVPIVNYSSKDYTFINNDEFTFQYKDTDDDDNSNVKEHTAKVSWIDKTAPTAEVKYSTEDRTDGPVTVSLANESENIIITNNNMSRNYTFTKNGKFTFEFEDEAGNKGTAIANVDWIKSEDEEDLLGDTSKDGTISETDVLQVKRHIVAGTNEEWILKDDRFTAADVNKDGKITATDLLLIKRLVLEQGKEND